ncbi:hypothetical protein ABVT39_025900, partial [Epinephelus coioides]
ITKVNPHSITNALMKALCRNAVRHLTKITDAFKEQLRAQENFAGLDFYFAAAELTLDPELHAVFCSPLEKLLFSSTSLELTANT